MNYKVEFAHYDDELTLPDGWVDTSWHNDACPSFEKNINGTIYRVWCDFKDSSLSEVGGLRFAVCAYDAKEDELTPLGEFNTLQEALNSIIN